MGSDEAYGTTNFNPKYIEYKFGDGVEPFPLTPATEGSSGIDLYNSSTERIVIKPKESQLISTGLYIALPEGYEAQIRSRSGLAAKYNIFVLNSPGTVDSDFRDEIKVILYNAGDKEFSVFNRDRIAQMVIQEVPKLKFIEVGQLSETKRGLNGMGSTGGFSTDQN